MTSFGSNRSAALLVGGVSLAVYTRTAYPTITWWDSSSYSLAADTLGLTSSPGSLLLTLFGWVATRVPWPLPAARVLNFLAGLIAAVTVVMVFVIAHRLLRSNGDAGFGAGDRAEVLGAGLGALTFAFSVTLWEHATKFTPYVLTAAFTALILLTMVRWWENAERPGAERWLLVLGLLFGLDFSVHRTNALLLPAALVWILLRHPRTLTMWRSWVAGASGLVTGLAVQILVIPIARTTRSPLNMFEPTTWPAFWDYVSLAQSGGGFLIDLWPRKAAFWSVQVADFLRVLGANFFSGGSPVRILGWLPAAAGVFGLLVLCRRQRRLAVAFSLVLLLQAAATILYFNIPAAYFRPLDRHYLPVMVTFGVLVAYGMGVAARGIARFVSARFSDAHPRLVVLGALALALLPAAQLFGNWKASDASGRHFTRDYAVNALEALPPNAIYFTAGDNDTFPVLYVQAVEGVRRDVRIINLSLANTSWYVDRIAREDPRFPLRLSRREREAATTAGWRDTAVVVSVRATAAQLDLPTDAPIPEAVTLRPKPFFGTQTLPADVVLLDIVSTNAWRDPITFAITAAPNRPAWLGGHARLDGLFWRLIPVADPPTESNRLRANLLDRYEYRGYNDPSIRIEDVTRMIALQYYAALRELLTSESRRGAVDRCREARASMFALLPPDRLTIPSSTLREIDAGCG